MTKIGKITLISKTVTTDSIGQPIVTTSTKELLAQEINSITLNEFSAGKQNGLSPDIRFRISSFAYNGEEIVEYGGTKYEVYRTYQADDNSVDIYCQRMVGVSSNIPAPTPGGGGTSG